MQIPTSLTVSFPNYKINPRLSGNSRGSAYLKREAQRQAKGDGQRLCLDALDQAGTFASEFLTGDFQHDLKEALPLRVVCRRIYSGRAKFMDKENCLMGFKYYLDGIARALMVNDRYFDLELEQTRDDFDELEIEIIPKWAVKE